MVGKGQSSIEYLTTYGWMILAVAVVGGVAYDNIGSSCTRSFSGFYSGDVEVKNFGVDGDGSFKVSLENEKYYTLEVKRFNVSSEDSSRYKDLSVSISPGGVAQLSVPGYSHAETCKTLDVEMVYDKGPLKGQVLRGTVRAPISIDAVAVPAAPYSLGAEA
ncbi:MAG: hypothetical protein ABEJ95_00835 [Candidatus Nanohalobium sp.]